MIDFLEVRVRTLALIRHDDARFVEVHAGQV
jgi:hypothetical protein